MAKLADILPIERDRQEPEKWNVIHLFKTGTFYSAYEWSACLTAVEASVNSYLGVLCHTASYHLRQDILGVKDFSKVIEIDADYLKCSVA